jgi:hypothetical protein
MKLISRLMAGLGLFVLLAAPTALAAPAPRTEPADFLYRQVCVGANWDSPFCRELRGQAAERRLFGPDGIVARVVGLLSFVIGVAAVIMIIIGGLKYVLSSGDPSNITAARNTIIYALVGVVIAAFGQAVVLFVLGRM